MSADEREQGAAGGRISLNLGHTVAHALEAVDGYSTLLHGEAVAYGLRAAVRIGAAVEVTPPARAARIERLLDDVDLGRAPLPCSPDAVLAATGSDKKHQGGRLRWVLPTGGRDRGARRRGRRRSSPAVIGDVVAGRPAAAAEATA